MIKRTAAGYLLGATVSTLIHQVLIRKTKVFDYGYTKLADEIRTKILWDFNASRRSA